MPGIVQTGYQYLRSDHLQASAPSYVDSPELTRINPLTDSRWDAFVESHPAGAPFHMSAWARVLVETYGYEPRYQALESGGELTAAWPAMAVRSRLTGRRLVSLPFSDFCAPLARNEVEASALLKGLISDVKEENLKWLEVRGWVEGATAPEDLVAVHGYLNHTIDLRNGAEAVLAGCSTSMRRNIRRAQKDGVSVRVGGSAEDLEVFRRLNLKLRRRHAMLPQPAGFFDSIRRNILTQGKGYLLLAELGDKPLAAVLALRLGDRVVDKFAVSDEAHWAHRANHLTLWESIRMEAEHGVNWYDLGRTDANAEGLIRFKDQWGATSREVPYFYYPRPGGQSTGDPSGWKHSALRTFSRLAPTFLFTRVGGLAYPHLG